MANELTLLPREMVAFGQPYALANGRVGIDSLAKPAIDEKTLTVRMRISTNAIDRDRMIIDQGGIDTEFYVDNPVVLFGHGEQGIHIPVALSEDADGRCTVWSEDTSTWAVAHHIADDETSMQIFDAVLKKLLRASSVGVTPKPGGIYHRVVGQEKIPIVDGCWLNEWSYCAVPVNPHALVKSYRPGRNVGEDILRESQLQCERASAILQINRLDGRPILEPIRKALLGLLPPKSPLVRVSETMKKTITRAQLKSLTRLQIAKMFKARNEYDDESKKEIGAAAAEAFPPSGEGSGEGESTEPAKGEAEPPVKDETQTEAGNEIVKSSDGGETADADAGEQSKGLSPTSDVGAVDPDGDGAANGADVDAVDTTEEIPESTAPSEPNQAELPGSLTVRAGYDTMKAAVDVFVRDMGQVELPEYKQKIQAEIDKIVESLAVIAETHDSQYPDAPKIAGSQVDNASELLKSLVKVDPRKQMAMSHLVRSLDAIVTQVSSGHFEKNRIAKSIAEKNDHLKKMLGTAAQLQVVPVEEYKKAVAQAEHYRAQALRLVSAYEKLDMQPEPITLCRKAGGL